MENNIFIEKSLKRYIKSKKIGYTASLLVGFLITGNILYGENISDRQVMEQKIKENNKRIEEIERRTVELLKEGDYYAKTLENNKQFFFPLNHEHRHASKGNDGAEIILGMEIIPPGKPEGPTETIPGIPIIPPGENGGPTTTVPGFDIIPQEKPGGPVTRPDKPTFPDKIETVFPEDTNLPEKSEGQTNIKPLELGELPEPHIEHFVPGINENVVLPEINKNSLAPVDTAIKPVEIDKNIDIDKGPDTIINMTEAEFQVLRPQLNYEYDPKEPTAPSLPVIGNVTAQNEIKLPELSVNTTKFDQGTGGILKQNKNVEAVVENYGKYETKGDGIEITFKDTMQPDGKMTSGISYENLENLVIHTVETTNKTENEKYLGEVDPEQIQNNLRKEYFNGTEAGATGETATFISTTMEKDSSVDGKYTLNYAGSDWNNATRSFLSVNTAGLLNKQGGGYNSIGKTDGGTANDGSTQEKKAVLTEFKGELNLENDIAEGKKYGTLVGIDHQLWDIQNDNNSTTDEYRKSYSIAKNSGTINLGEKDGQDKNLVGISIETEDDQNRGRTKHKIHNHVTVNAGKIEINGQNSIGITFEDGADVADDLYSGNVNLNESSKESYGIRLKNSHKNTSKIQFNSVRVFGSVSDNINLGATENGEDLNLDNKIDDKINGKNETKKISVDGNNNGGFVIAKSLSSNATKYLKKDVTDKGDDMPAYSGVKEEEYLGIFADDIKVKNENGEEVAFEGYDNGKVDPLANVHGLNIEVGGKTNVGFLRHRDYSDNNANEMVITNTSTSAVKDIDFKENASGSVLIRSDMYGIKVEKDLNIEGNGVGTAAAASQNAEENADKNVILQASRSIWEKDGQKVKSVGNITNSGNIKSSINNVIGMMVNDGTNEDKDNFDNIAGLNGYNGADNTGKAVIKNTGEINLQGESVIGMAVLGDNIGILENGKVDTVMTVSPKPENNQENNPENITENKNYNVSIYNDGTFNIKNSEILTSGNGSVAVYNNNGTVNITAEDGKTNKITADNGAVALYSKGGSLTANGKLEINPDSTAEKNHGIGIYGAEGTKININGQDNIINVENGAAGIVSKGNGTEITLNNTDLNYTGSGYALYDEEGGKINIKNSKINLNGKSAGMKVIWGEGNNNITFDENSKIYVNSDDVVVFNIIGEGKNQLNSNLSELQNEIAKQLGADPNNPQMNLHNLIEVKDGITKYKEAMVDGGSLAIDKNIYQDETKAENEENKKLGEFYFKRFLGTKLHTTVNDNIKVNAEITTAKADADYNGKVTGLEIVSSTTAENVKDTSITLNKDAEVIANRIEKTDEELKEEQKKTHATVGIFTNFAEVNMLDGSKITVEKTTDEKNDTSANGVGIFAVNGSQVNIGKNYNDKAENENAKIEVFGDKAVGVYAKASREENNQILDNEYGEQKGQGLINITNNGVIDVSHGNGTIGISAYNNYNAEDKTGHGAENNHVVNNGLIKTGSSDEKNSSVGIYGDKVTITNNNKIEVGNGKETQKDGTAEYYGGVGIYAVNGAVVDKIGTLVLGDYAAGVVVDGKSEITDTEDLEFRTNGNTAENTGKNKIGIAYNNAGRTEVREHNFNVIGDNKVSGLRAIVSEGGSLVINKDKNITLGDNDNRGITVSNGSGENRGTITINDSGATADKITTSVGMTASGKGSVITNTGEINLNGKKSVGMFVKNDGAENIGNTLGNIGTINLNGQENTAVYVKHSAEELKLSNFIKTDGTGIQFGENSSNSTGIQIHGSNISIDKDISQNLENNNILLKAVNGSAVTNNSTLTISSQHKADKVVGIVLDEDSMYSGTGKIKVEGGAIGIYAKAGDQKTFNNLKFETVSRGMNAVGFALKGQGGEANKENSRVLLDGITEINLLQAEQTPKTADQSENKGVGIITTATDLAINRMELKYDGTSGIGIYLKGTASIVRENGKENLLHISSISDKEPTDYSVGIYAAESSGTEDTTVKDIDIDIDIDKAKSIGIYNDKAELVYHGKIDNNIEDSIGIFTSEDKKVTLLEGSEINVTGKDGEGNASAGVSAKDGSQVVNKGNITTNGSRDVGIYGENATVANSGTITAHGGTGVFITGEDSSFDGTGGTISTWQDDKSQTAVYLSNGAEIKNGVGNLDIGKGDIGIYAEGTTIDGSVFAAKDDKGRGKFSVSSNDDVKENEVGAMGIVSDNSEIKNLNIALGNNAIGIVGLDGKINVENVSFTAKSEVFTTGIYLGKKSDNSISEDNFVNNINVNIKNGYGILMQDSDDGKGTKLNLTNSILNVQNTFKEENKKTAGVFVGENNKFTSSGNEYKISNNVGVYGKSGSQITLNNDNMTLWGKSIGVYSDGGNVIIDEKSKIAPFAVNEANGGAVYVQGGNIQNSGTIEGIASNFYGLAVNGDGKITNDGKVMLGGGNVIALSLEGALGNSKNLIDNNGIVAVDGLENKRAIGIYGTKTNIETENISVGNYATGILYDNTQGKYTDYYVKSNEQIKITGSNSVGATLKGTAGEILINDISVIDKGNAQNNMGVYAKDLQAKSFTVNNIYLKDNSLGMYFNNSNVTADIGSITVGNGVDGKASIGIGVFKGDVALNIKDKISAGENGTAVLAQGGKVTINDITKLSVGAGNGSIIHSNGGEVVLKDVAGKDKYEINIDGHYGFILENGGKIHGDENFKKKELSLNVKNNGTGIIFSQTDEQAEKTERPFSDMGVTEIKVEGSTAENNDGYTKGLYYKNLGEIKEDLSDVKMTLSGKNTVGLVLNGTYGEITVKDVVFGEEAQNSTAILVKGSDDYKEKPADSSHVTTITGNITVKDKNIGGAEQATGNIGLEVQNASASTNGNITVGEGYNFENRYPVGVYAVNNIKDKDGNMLEDRNYIYTGNGELTVGNFATGVAAKNFDIIYNGNVTAGVGAVGILAENELYKHAKNYVAVLGNITVGDEKLSDSERKKGIGIYGKNADIRVGAGTDPVEMNIKNNKQNIGILSTEKGDIEFYGNVNIAGNENIERGKYSAVGIYKNGSGTVEIGKGNWTVGENSFGVIVNSKAEKKEEISLTNESSMTIKKGAVGIYSSGNNTVTNKGNLTVNGIGENISGESTVGIYMQNDGDKTSVGTNSGTITADGKNSVGVQAAGNVQFTNEKDGVINVLNGGIGMYAVNGAEIKNDGTINLGDENGKNSTGSIGMYGQGKGTKIINNGVINANHGTGMYVEEGAELYNYKDINIKNGIGIKGSGNLVNKGNIHLEKDYNGILEDTGSGNGISADSIIKIENDIAVIGPNYTGIGGNLESDFDLQLKNPTIDITDKNGLGFNAPNISGGITPTPDFIQKGNGYSFDVKDFAADDVNLDINTSPLFDGKIVDGDLLMNKVDYKDVLKDYEYEEFYNALDETLRTGISQDIDALKNLNTYLDSFKNNPDEFNKQYDKLMGEARGSIYSHVQGRMQDINRTFDNAFDEMEQSYNLSKDTDKFSVIHTNGDYKNGRTQVPDYEYRITGLLYMKEFEGTKSRDKHGYSYGFTGSRFKFDDTGSSKEDVYSLRGGLHNVKYFDKDLNLLTKLEAGINYHETDRKVFDGKMTHNNDSDFWSYYISFDNKFRKTLYQNYQNEFGAYAGFEAEYGRFTDIKEDGTLALKIKENDYLSAKAVAGFNGTARKYLGNDWTGKIMGDVGYSYDFGHNYKENESKLRRTDSDYISLMSEIETKGRVGGKIGIGAERLNYMGVTLEAEAARDIERDEDYWRVGLRFNYKFNSEDAVTTLRNTFNLFGNHFDFDKDNLKRKEQDIIEMGSKIIDKYNLKGTLVLEGHTDSKGSVEYNQGLSERRAETVKKELSSQITKSGNIKYKTKGYSELKPVDTNETAEGRANNRRVEVKYIPDSKNKTAE